MRQSRSFHKLGIVDDLFSGMYMGELIRQVLVDLMKDDLIFLDVNRETLLERGKCPEPIKN